MVRAKVSRRGPRISHLLFVDDSILFREASQRGASALKEVLWEYENVLGQCVNFDKSMAFYSSNTLDSIRNEVSHILNIKNSINPKRYLGLSNMVGRNKKFAFQVLKDRMHQKISNWSSCYLS